MKNRIIILGTALAVLICAVIFIGLDHENLSGRYHQHREQPGETGLGKCEICSGEADLCTHLPIIRIETGGQKIPGNAIVDDTFAIVGYETGDNGEEMIEVSIDTIEEEGNWHHPEDAASQSSSALIRYRGNSSRAFSKHSYRIELIEDGSAEQNRDLPLLGMSAESEWALHGPFLDKTLVRNYMWMNLSAEVMGYAPEVRFCELVVDGKYQGVYVLMETIREGEGRVNLTDYEPGDLVSSYILELGEEMNPLKTIDNFTYYTLRLEEFKEMEILYPPLRYQTEELQEYIRADFNEIERLLYSAHMNDRSRLYQDYLDMNSFVDYFILQELLMVNDAFSASTFFYRDVRGKLHIGPVWDYNNALDNFFNPVDTEAFILAQKGWYAQLMMDEEFVERVIARYRQLREGVLAEDSLNGYLDETLAWLGSAAERNYEVWGYSFDVEQLKGGEYRWPAISEMREMAQAGEKAYVQFMEEQIAALNPDSFEEAVEWMRTTMTERGDWMDRHIESLRQYCADSKNATRIIY